MSDAPWTAVLVQVAMGFSLAACAGFRAFLPLLALGAAGRFGFVALGPGFGWLSTNEALAILLLATLFELAGDKVPAVDHLLDAAGLVLKPAAGFLLVAAPIVGLDPRWKALLALLAGSTVAGAIHLGKAKIRVLSTIGTAGFANPLLSVAEDAIGFTGTVAALLVPVLAALVALALLVVLAFLVAGRLGRPERRRAA